MSGESNRLEEIVSLAAMLRDRDLNRLSLAVRKISAMEGEIAALDQELWRRLTQRCSSPVPDASQRSGQDEKWQAWLEHKQSQLRKHFALLVAERDAARDQALKSVGRADALRHVANITAQKIRL